MNNQPLRFPVGTVVGPRHDRVKYRRNRKTRDVENINLILGHEHRVLSLCHALAFGEIDLPLAARLGLRRTIPEQPYGDAGRRTPRETTVRTSLVQQMYCMITTTARRSLDSLDEFFT
ncbi:hypothetical protein EVAR_40504_1 [Eumeta japonica]|uniref:Uncharacterized protein n=1 Tax=Eumeta variegata TaxID=151549 RepID=A0A4C1XXA2_EUMVA|nr:hypothetical protein EVAR_40504_1 [Eumeta japonica]